MRIIDYKDINIISKKVDIDRLFSYQLIILSLKEKLREFGGAGLAAPQLSKFVQIFIWTKDRTEKSLKTAINPIMTPLKKFGTQQSIEGCFSVKDHLYEIVRWKKIEVAYYDDAGVPHNEILEDFEASVFQHEFDHLRALSIVDKGILFESPSNKENNDFSLKTVGGK